MKTKSTNSMKTCLLSLSTLFLLSACQPSVGGGGPGGGGQNPVPTTTKDPEIPKTSTKPAENPGPVATTAPQTSAPVEVSASEQEDPSGFLQLKVKNVLQESIESAAPSSEWAEVSDQYKVEVSFSGVRSKDFSLERVLLQGSSVLSTETINCELTAAEVGMMHTTDALDFSKYPNLAPITVVYSVRQNGVISSHVTKRVLRNYVVDGRVDLNEKPILSDAMATAGAHKLDLDQLVFLPQSQLITEGKDLSLTIKNLIVVEKASVISFDKIIENGRPGGNILLQAEKAQGTLQVDLHGQKGTQGSKGTDRAQDDRPGKGQGANMSVVTRTRHGRGCGDTYACPEYTTCQLIRAADDGAKGFKGFAGGNGFVGGNGGTFTLVTDPNSKSFAVNFSARAGAGGEGGVGGNGGLPGDPGDPFQNPNCPYPGGNAGVNGAQGENGQPGVAGQDGKYTVNP